eukprot:15464071-Alexandrium_andersonii.AAC.1
MQPPSPAWCGHYGFRAKAGGSPTTWLARLWASKPTGMERSTFACSPGVGSAARAALGASGWPSAGS